MSGTLFAPELTPVTQEMASPSPLDASAEEDDGPDEYDEYDPDKIVVSARCLCFG